MKYILAAALVGLAYAQSDLEDYVYETTDGYSRYDLDDQRVLDFVKEKYVKPVTENHYIIFTVSSNPTTGYDWIYETNETCDKVELIQEYETSTDDMEMMGAGGITTLKVVANKGYHDLTCEVHAVYMRSWEFESWETAK